MHGLNATCMPSIAFLQVGCLLWQTGHCCRPKRCRQSAQFQSGRRPPQMQSESMHSCSSSMVSNCLLSATRDAQAQQLPGMSLSDLKCAVVGHAANWTAICT